MRGKRMGCTGMCKHPVSCAVSWRDMFAICALYTRPPLICDPADERAYAYCGEFGHVLRFSVVHRYSCPDQSDWYCCGLDRSLRPADVAGDAGDDGDIPAFHGVDEHH